MIRWVISTASLPFALAQEAKRKEKKSCKCKMALTLENSRPLPLWRVFSHVRHRDLSLKITPIMLKQEACASWDTHKLFLKIEFLELALLPTEKVSLHKEVHYSCKQYPRSVKGLLTANAPINTSCSCCDVLEGVTGSYHPLPSCCRW